LAVLAYFGIVIALAASSLSLIDHLLMRSGEIATAQMRLDQLTEHSRPKASALLASDASVSGSPFVDGRTVTIAGATLQQLMEPAVAKAGGTLVCGAIVTPMEGAYGDQERHPGRFAGGA
jgi:general secretion pathway protein M